MEKENSVVAEYKRLHGLVTLLRDLPEDKKPKSQGAIAEWKTELLKQEHTLRQTEKRLTFDQKKELRALGMLADRQQIHA